MAKKNSNEESIIKALAYSGVFSYPLSFFQICFYMNQPIRHKALKSALKRLGKERKIICHNEKYFLPNIVPVDWDKALNESKKLSEKYTKTLKKLGRLPWIKLLAFTGTLAASNPDKKGDIDIFIVTSPNRLWLTRVFVVLYLKIWGLYRTDANSREKVCPNLYLAENNLRWPRKQRNMYIASEIVRIQPIINKFDTYERFLNANRWIKNYFPNFVIPKIKKTSKNNPGILDLAEKVLFVGQKIYMRKRIKSEKISHNIIHFNKNDKTRSILDAYNKGF